MTQNTTPAINTKTCPRCCGTGHYSFNLRDGTRCYGCGGTGKVLCTPKGQKKVKTTCERLEEAKAGDIIKVACVLYRVREVLWITNRRRNGWEVNTQVRVTRLVDNHDCAFTALREDEHCKPIIVPESKHNTPVIEGEVFWQAQLNAWQEKHDQAEMLACDLVAEGYQDVSITFQNMVCYKDQEGTQKYNTDFIVY